MARILPEVTQANEPFWRGGEKGELRFLRCKACGFYNHPPTPICPRCEGRDLEWTPVSGKGVVVSVTVNHQAWMPDEALPYAIAVVEMNEQPGLRLLTNIVGCWVEEVKIGMPVRVSFEKNGDVHVPLFEPER
jgi:uncharacterized OB-fold protein